MLDLQFRRFSLIGELAQFPQELDRAVRMFTELSDQPPPFVH